MRVWLKELDFLLPFECFSCFMLSATNNNKALQTFWIVSFFGVCRSAYECEEACWLTTMRPSCVPATRYAPRTSTKESSAKCKEEAVAISLKLTVLSSQMPCFWGLCNGAWFFLEMCRFFCNVCAFRAYLEMFGAAYEMSRRRAALVHLQRNSKCSIIPYLLVQGGTCCLRLELNICRCWTDELKKKWILITFETKKKKWI